jgi:hypothetical protein
MKIYLVGSSRLNGITICTHLCEHNGTFITGYAIWTLNNGIYTINLNSIINGINRTYIKTSIYNGTNESNRIMKEFFTANII